MANVDVIAVSGHVGNTVHVDHRGQWHWQPQCVCGWVGPRYPDNDAGTAATGLVAHCANENEKNPLPSQFFTDLLRQQPADGVTVSYRKPVIWL